MGKLHVRRSLQRLLACAVLLLAGTPAFAQFERSAISGTIRDQQGGVMPGVTVTATNVATGVVETTVTDDSGFYTFSTLLPGHARRRLLRVAHLRRALRPTLRPRWTWRSVVSLTPLIAQIRGVRVRGAEYSTAFCVSICTFVPVKQAN